VTGPEALKQLIARGAWVSVTNPGNRSCWAGRIIAYAPDPSVVIEGADGTRFCLPASFSVVEVQPPSMAGRSHAPAVAPNGAPRVSAGGSAPRRAAEGLAEVGRADLLLILGAVAGTTPPSGWHPGLLHAWNRLSSAAGRTP